MRISFLVTCAVLLLAIAGTSRAETPAARELQQLIEQRDKAIAPIITRFNAAAEQLLKRAMQAGALETVEKVKAEMANAALPGTAKSARELQTQLAGTTWKAVPSAPLRGGFAASLNFTDKTVEPGGYAYEADSHNKVTITFRGGDTQIMQLSQDGKQMKFSFRNSNFVYERVPR
jgi:hypothetical protein